MRYLANDEGTERPDAPQEDPSGGFQEGGWLVPFMDEQAGEIVA